MKIKQSYKQALRKLVNGPKKDIEITNGDCIATQTQIHIVRWLEECQALGYCVKVNDQWMLTESGRAAIDLKEEKTRNRICALSMTETYDGAELRQLGNRKGAYDFLSVPSRFFDTRVYRPDAKVL